MLNVMRKHAGSWMIKVILFAIVIVFVFWGVGSFDPTDRSRVATVNDETISISDYRWAYNNLLEQYRQRLGANFNDEMIEMLQLKSQALNQLIDRAIILQEARKLNLRVTDAEVAQSLIETPVFQTDGTFDKDRYLNLLSQNNISPEEYEADQKRVLLGEKLTRIVMAAAKVSDEEARMWFDWQNKSVSIDYVLFASARHTDITPTKEEIAAHYEAKKESYKTSPMVKTRHVVFDPAAYREKVTVRDDQIADYYDSHLSEFKTEKSVEARHILIKVAETASEEEDEAARTKAQELTDLAQSGKDFAELAKTHSEGPSKDQGGYLGKFRRNQMVKPFADKAFSMTAGQISDPVKTQFGWHVIKVESVTDASTRTLDESKGQIRAKLKNREARNLAYDTAEQFYESSYEAEDLVNNAKAFDLTVKEAGPFDRNGPQELGQQKSAFAQTAFALKTDEISEVQEIDGRYYIIQAIEQIAAAIPELDKVRAKVEEDLTRKMQSDKAREQAAAMAADLAAGKSFAQSAETHGVKVKTTDLFGRNAPIDDLRSAPQVAAAAFELGEVDSTSKEPVSGADGFYLLRLAEKKLPETQRYENEKENVKNMLLGQKRRAVLQDWLEARKNGSQIDIDKTILE